MAVAKCEAEIITIATQFSVFFHNDQDEWVLIYHFSIWAFAWNDHQLLKWLARYCVFLLYAQLL